MKKHLNADQFARQLIMAANQPPVAMALPPATTPQAESAPVVAPESTETPPAEESGVGRAPKNRRSGKAASEKPKDDTVPISLRPPRALLTRYVTAASERSVESGRVISAQQIMLEVLERGP
jgi:hypothetical protein